VDVSDYVADVISPEVETLAAMGTEIMWCVIGGLNLTAEFASAWFNGQAEMRRHVVMNSRSRLPGDFDTPEYARYDAVQVRK
jgi:alpha-L-fucosidase